MSKTCNLFHLKTRTQCSFAKVQLRFSFSLAAKATGMSPLWNRPPFKFFDSWRLLRSALFASFQPSKIHWTHIHPALLRDEEANKQLYVFRISNRGDRWWWCRWRGQRERVTWSSAECPRLQVHDSKVIGFRQATVVEGEAGAAAAEVQILIHPQTKVTTEGRKCRAKGKK